MASHRALSLQLKEEGNILFKAQQYEASIQKFTEAILLDNRNPAFYGNRAASYYFLRRYQEVLNDCQIALNLDPRYLKAWLRKGDAHDALTQYADSIDSYNRALDLTPRRESGHDELQRRISHVKAKIINPCTVYVLSSFVPAHQFDNGLSYSGLETLIALSRLHGIQIPNLQSIQTPAQIDELRKALFRHPKWTFPLPPSSGSHSSKPHPARIRFFLIPSDDHLPLSARSTIELDLEHEPAKKYDAEMRKLLGGCARYTREIVLSEDWEKSAQQLQQRHLQQSPTQYRTPGVPLGRHHAAYEIYYPVPSDSREASSRTRPIQNTRASSLLVHPNLCGPVLVAKAWYVKAERMAMELPRPGSSTSPVDGVCGAGGSALLGYDHLSLDELQSDMFQSRRREWGAVCRTVVGSAAC
ncbi:hypothetical protein FA15DRAFT_82472 [Coprinopsis marcescibilis]|uniref:Uncharacterized protein n=1 Tax=Coprinopsis marcescibilis TaxID=230819 RepID=A0A5C3KMW8_COPMA|nr:hypothetical protein FA15DRAFT_82472 [Coprinopsis marcescibilis]